MIFSFFLMYVNNNFPFSQHESNIKNLKLTLKKIIITNIHKKKKKKRENHNNKF